MVFCLIESIPEVDPLEVLEAGEAGGSEVGDVVGGQVHVLQRILHRFVFNICLLIFTKFRLGCRCLHF